MTLNLVTGPANAAKAGAVLGPLRARLGEEPVLVVPAFQDVEHTRRELAETGATFGVRVVRFSHLFGLIARRTGYAARRATELQRRLVGEDAVRRAELTVMAESAQRPGFVRALLRFATELEQTGIEPASLTAALRRWAGNGPRRAYAAEVAEVYARYREGLDAADLVDEDLFAWRAWQSLVHDGAAWGATPVFVYGFDDFTGMELRTLEELAKNADVTVSLPFEAGRAAFKATATLREDLRARGAIETERHASDDHYAPESRAALHALERGLFEDPAKRVGLREERSRTGGPASTAVGFSAVRLHSAGGERAELELCGAEVLTLLREGIPAGQVAVVVRDPPRYASLLEQVFGAYGIPYSIDRSVPFAHTGIGRGLLALLRCAVLEGSAEDLLAYLRTPGFLREARLADRLEADVRREGELTADGARRIWEGTANRWPLEEIDRIRAADTPARLAAVLQRRLHGLFAGPHRRRAPVLWGAELDDPRSFRAAHEALVELRGVVEADSRVRLEARALHDMLAELPVPVGEPEQPDRVQVASPLDVRARRFAAVLMCGLQEGEFPQGAAPDAFLPDSDRREINRVAGLSLPLREDRLDRERYLFYVCASRAERLLVLSSRYCDEDGDPQSRSFFVDEAEVVFGDLQGTTRRRSLADVTWPPEEAPTPAEWERAVARAGESRTSPAVGDLRLPAALRRVGEREVVSASALERFAGCPVKWLVEDVLDPERLEPDPEQMVRGQYAHRVLELTFRRLREQTGHKRVTRANLGQAERILLEALTEQRGEFRVSPDQTRVRAAVRRLEFDLLRYLRHESGSDSLFVPEHLEMRFGFEDSGHPSVEVAGGVRVRGVIDRVDTWDGYGLVRDYKGGKVDTYKAADWESERRFQAALYMLVIERVLGLKAAGGVYVPLGGDKRRARGLVSAELGAQLGGDFVDTDRRPEEEFADREAWAREAIAEAAERMRGGRLASCPDTCAYRGGCSHPSVCRVEQ
ncbi:MAG: PD-(D/E)XK nuclease family protein [Thermoleophilaceae bacterium]